MQLGHATDTAEPFDVLRSIAGSPTGRKHYTDLRSKLLERAASATAVRELLDEAVARVLVCHRPGQTSANGTDQAQA